MALYARHAPHANKENSFAGTPDEESEARGDASRLLKAVMKGAAPRLKATVARSSDSSKAAVLQPRTQASSTPRANSSSSVAPALSSSGASVRDSKIQTPARGRLSVGPLDRLGLVSRSTGKPLTPPPRRASSARSATGTDEEIVQALRTRQRQLLRQNNHLADLYEEASKHNKALEKTNKRLEQEVLRLRLELARLRVPNAAPPAPATRRASRGVSDGKATADTSTQTSAAKPARQSRGTGVVGPSLTDSACESRGVELQDHVHALAPSPPASSRRTERTAPTVTRTPRRPVHGEAQRFDSLYNLLSPPRHTAPLRSKPTARPSSSRPTAQSQRGGAHMSKAPPAELGAEEAPRQRRAVASVVSYREPSLTQKLTRSHGGVFFKKRQER